jgi:hypothetical protein
LRTSLLLMNLKPARRLGWLCIAAFMATCSPAEKQATPTTDQAGAAACAANPNRAPAVAERGLGGTGLSSGSPRTADRGVGGTGIVGIITGFGSVCVNAREVAYDQSTAVLIEGAAAGVEALRTGQVVAIEADGDELSRARKLSIFYQISGPIDHVADARAFRVAGQPVIARVGAIPQGVSLRVGDWINVSGLRASTGEVMATRLDRRAPGGVLVRGRLLGTPDAYRIGELTVRLPSGSSATTGQFIIAQGSYDGETLTADSATADLLATDPLALFGSSVDHFSIESFVSLAGGRLQNPAGWIVPLSQGVRDGLLMDRPIVIELERGKDGGSSVTRLLDAPSFLSPPGLGLSPKTDRPGPLPPGGAQSGMGRDLPGGTIRPGPFAPGAPGSPPGLPSGGARGGGPPL